MNDEGYYINIPPVVVPDSYYDEWSTDFDNWDYTYTWDYTYDWDYYYTYDWDWDYTYDWTSYTYDWGYTYGWDSYYQSDLDYLTSIDPYSADMNDINALMDFIGGF